MQPVSHVEVVAVHHEVAVDVDDDRVGRLGEGPDVGVVAQRLDDEDAAGPQHAAELREDDLVLLVVEVAERREPADHRVERAVDGQGAQVALDELDVDAALGGLGARDLEEPRSSGRPR